MKRLLSIISLLMCIVSLSAQDIQLPFAFKAVAQRRTFVGQEAETKNLSTALNIMFDGDKVTLTFEDETEPFISESVIRTSKVKSEDEDVMYAIEVTESNYALTTYFFLEKQTITLASGTKTIAYSLRIPRSLYGMTMGYTEYTGFE